MGRAKTYDRDEVIDRAMQVFWDRGYHAASTRDLADAMGVNSYSLYAEFGSKERLYDEAMLRYDELVVTKHFGAMETAEATLDHVEAVLHYFGGSHDVTTSSLGCLASNAAVERAPTAEASKASTDRYLNRVVNAFRNALQNALDSGRLIAGTPIDELAGFLAVTVTGMLVLIRAGSDPALLSASRTHALGRLNEFRTSDGGYISQ
jgi:TetR/AcrR family transcriptional regulator, transcriptional repressor for nem operon